MSGNKCLRSFKVWRTIVVGIEIFQIQEHVGTLICLFITLSIRYPKFEIRRIVYRVHYIAAFDRYSIGKIDKFFAIDLAMLFLDESLSSRHVRRGGKRERRDREAEKNGAESVSHR